MTSFADLTFFRYTESKWAFANGFPYVLLNVGWLGDAVPKPHRKLEESEIKSILYNLSQYMMFSVNLYRGTHSCEICGFSPDRGEKSGMNRGGNGELFIPGRNNLVYVAPTMIYHYVEHDGYVPPEEFIDAVRNIATMGSYRLFFDIYNKYPDSDLTSR
jgi:hypothetical protein